MGFYSPHSLVQDARRHGVVVHTPDVNASARTATLEPCEGSTGGLAVRLGISSVRSLGDELADRIATGRPYRDMEDVRRRSGAGLATLEALATAGGVRLLRADPPGGVVGGGCGGPGRCRPVGRHRHRGARPAAARPGRRGGGAGRPVGHRHQPRWAPHPLPPGVVGGVGGGDRRGVAVGAERVEGAGGRGGHPSPTSGDGRRHDVPEPRGRDRPDQRGGVQGVLGPSPAGGPGGAGAAGEGPSGAWRRRCVERDRRARLEPMAATVGELRSRDFR
ncbi:MAG: hypothetical protein R2749_07850 [Acidimicrobiales bacterium]